MRFQYSARLLYLHFRSKTSSKNAPKVNLERLDGGEVKRGQIKVLMLLKIKVIIFKISENEDNITIKKEAFI